MNIETIETILVILIVSIQLVMFIRTKGQINKFRGAIPDENSTRVSKIFLSQSELETREPKEILANLPELENKERVSTVPKSGYTEIAFPYLPTRFEEVSTVPKSSYKEIAVLVDESANQKEVFENILFTINTYLIRNHTATPDFNLIKDITERNIDAIEEEINLTISVPLFLGLMGTMLGIVIGLFSMSDLSLTLSNNPGTANDPLAQGITVLLGGVKIAMIASFTGLLLTTINSGWFFKGSKSLIDAHKNKFYSFLQTELLPVMSQSLGSVFDSLQKNLSKFNKEFEDNLTKLSNTFETQFDSLASLENVLLGLKDIDITTITTHNVKVLKELKSTVDAFEKFNTHASNIDSSLENSTALVNRLNQVLERTEDVQAIASKLDKNLEENKGLLEFLTQHFKMLEDYKKQTTESIAKTGFSISEVFDQLKTYIEKSGEMIKGTSTETKTEAGEYMRKTFEQLTTLIDNSSQTLKEFTVEEVELLKKAISENKTNLGKLEFLETINKDVGLFKDSTASQGERIRMLLQEVNKNLDNSNRTLNRIEHTAFGRKSLKTFLKQLFYSDNGNNQELSELHQKERQKEIESYQSEISNLKLELEKLSSRVKSFTEIRPKPPEILPTIESDQEVFYLSTPNEDASFYAKSAQSVYQEGTSIYKFTKISFDQAEFKIDEREASVKLALQYPGENIEPVCDANNNYSTKASRIVTLEAGKAELVGERWRVISRAFISYES